MALNTPQTQPSHPAAFCRLAGSLLLCSCLLWWCWAQLSSGVGWLFNGSEHSQQRLRRRHVR